MRSKRLPWACSGPNVDVLPPNSLIPELPALYPSLLLCLGLSRGSLELIVGRVVSDGQFFPSSVVPVAWKPHPLPEYLGWWKKFSFHVEGKKSSTSLMASPHHVSCAAPLQRCLQRGTGWPWDSPAHPVLGSWRNPVGEKLCQLCCPTGLVCGAAQSQIPSFTSQEMLQSSI